MKNIILSFLFWMILIVTCAFINAFIFDNIVFISVASLFVGVLSMEITEKFYKYLNKRMTKRKKALTRKI